MYFLFESYGICNEWMLSGVLRLSLAVGALCGMWCMAAQGYVFKEDINRSVGEH